MSVSESNELHPPL